MKSISWCIAIGFCATLIIMVAWDPSSRHSVCEAARQGDQLLLKWDFIQTYGRQHIDGDYAINLVDRDGVHLPPQPVYQVMCGW